MDILGYILGIETSCDETAAAVVKNNPDGVQLLSNIVSSQTDVHHAYGGVVPELASRQHVRNIVPVIEQCLKDANLSFTDLDGVAVTRGPGLVGALLVGVQVAKAIAYTHRLPLIGVNHLEGHLCSARLSPNASPAASPPDRHVALLVSGGHTMLFLVEAFGRYQLLGASRDDAAGEAFDKVAKLLGLGYPGGPMIEQVAKSGDIQAVALPRALPRRDDLDFSFSGLKTAVATYVQKHQPLTPTQIADLCASFQHAVADVLVRKTTHAALTSNVSAVVAGGGVMANSAIRSALMTALSQHNIALHIPPIKFCTDNAAMIAVAGALRLQAGERSSYDLNAEARLPL